jgi:hypothetical protein
MQGLMERGIVEPSESPHGTANVFVPKKALPDGTSGGLRVTADMRAVNSVTMATHFLARISKLSSTGSRGRNGLALQIAMGIGMSNLQKSRERTRRSKQ